MTHFDDLETRTPADRDTAQLAMLNGLLGGPLASLSDLASQPVLRKSDLSAAQKAKPPFGGLTDRKSVV